MRFVFSNIFFCILVIEFREAKQIIVTFIATTFKAMLSVTKTNSRLSGHKFYAGNIYYSFLNILAHIFPINIQKRCATEATHPKKHKPLLLRNKPLTNRRIIHIRKDGTCTFFQIQIFTNAKRQSIPMQKNTPKCHIRFVSQVYYITFFALCKQVWHFFVLQYFLSIYNNPKNKRL